MFAKYMVSGLAHQLHSVEENVKNVKKDFATFASVIALFFF
jgi:hypothetical protein